MACDTSKAEISLHRRDLAISTFLAQNIGQCSASVKKRVAVITVNSGRVSTCYVGDAEIRSSGEGTLTAAIPAAVAA
jgi:hypothetical protein